MGTIAGDVKGTTDNCEIVPKFVVTKHNFGRDGHNEIESIHFPHFFATAFWEFGFWVSWQHWLRHPKQSSTVHVSCVRTHPNVFKMRTLFFSFPFPLVMKWLHVVLFVVFLPTGHLKQTEAAGNKISPQFGKTGIRYFCGLLVLPMQDSTNSFFVSWLNVLSHEKAKREKWQE